MQHRAVCALEQREVIGERKKNTHNRDMKNTFVPFGTEEVGDRVRKPQESDPVFRVCMGLKTILWCDNVYTPQYLVSISLLTPVRWQGHEK